MIINKNIFNKIPYDTEYATLRVKTKYKDSMVLLAECIDKSAKDSIIVCNVDYSPRKPIFCNKSSLVFKVNVGMCIVHTKYNMYERAIDVSTKVWSVVAMRYNDSDVEIDIELLDIYEDPIDIAYPSGELFDRITYCINVTSSINSDRNIDKYIYGIHTVKFRHMTGKLTSLPIENKTDRIENIGIRRLLDTVKRYPIDGIKLLSIYYTIERDKVNAYLRIVNTSVNKLRTRDIDKIESVTIPASSITYKLNLEDKNIYNMIHRAYVCDCSDIESLKAKVSKYKNGLNRLLVCKL